MNNAAIAASYRTTEASCVVEEVDCGKNLAASCFTLETTKVEYA